MMRAKMTWLFVMTAFVAGSSRSEAGILYASDSGGGSSRIFQLDSDTGAVLGSFAGPGRFADAVSLAPDGTSLFILNSFPNPSLVYRTDLAGNLLSSFAINLDAEGLDVLNDGRLVIGGGTSNTIALVSQTGTIQSSFTPQANTVGIATDGTSTIFGLRFNGTIDRYNLAGNYLGSVTTSGISQALGLAYTGNSFFISEARAGGRIVEVSLTGTTIRSFTAPGTFTEGLDITVVPAPPAAVLLAVGGLVLLGRRRRRAG
jgi:hypothetical protein